jgi:hypothetical protein
VLGSHKNVGKTGEDLMEHISLSGSKHALKYITLKKVGNCLGVCLVWCMVWLGIC